MGATEPLTVRRRHSGADATHLCAHLRNTVPHRGLLSVQKPPSLLFPHLFSNFPTVSEFRNARGRHHHPNGVAACSLGHAVYPLQNCALRGIIVTHNSPGQSWSDNLHAHIQQAASPLVPHIPPPNSHFSREGGRVFDKRIECMRRRSKRECVYCACAQYLYRVYNSV